MSSEIKAMHVANFFRLSARYLDEAWTGDACGGEAAPEPAVPRNRARAAMGPSARGVQVINARCRRPRGRAVASACSRAFLCMHPLAYLRQPMQAHRWIRPSGGE